MKRYVSCKVLSSYRLKILLCSIVLGLLFMVVFSGKSRVDLETVAVSQNEKFVACFKTGDGPKILCFFADGTLAFEYNVNSDISAGGYCTLWFEDEMLYVLFYRTDKIVCFSTDGTIQKILDSELEEYPVEFPSFIKKENKFIYHGNNLNVVYDKRSFFEYWILGADRYLTISPKDGDAVTVMSWGAAK